jgi:hypothetical protein
MSTIKGQSIPVLPDTIQFSIPVLLKLPNQMSGKGWQVAFAQRKKLMPLVHEATRAWHGREPIDRAVVTVTRFATGPECDDDNAAASVKPLVDLLLVRSKTHPHSVGIVVDDSPAHMIQNSRVVRVATRKEQRTEVTIQRLD